MQRREDKNLLAQLKNKMLLAANAEDLTVIKELINKNPDYENDLFKTGFTHAAQNGFQSVMVYLFDIAPQAIVESILKFSTIFFSATLNGHVKTAKYIWEKMQNNETEREYQLKQEDYKLLAAAFRKGNIEMIEFLWSITKDQEKEIILNKLTNGTSKNNLGLHLFGNQLNSNNIFDILQKGLPIALQPKIGDIQSFLGIKKMSDENSKGNLPFFSKNTATELDQSKGKHEVLDSDSEIFIFNKLQS